MADKIQEPQEKKIPVLTVFKKGLIFKNIFLLDNNTSSPPSIPIKSHVIQNPKDEYEEILLVGRHPDCNIMLEHPSISRFHLEIHLQPSLQKLFVIDLSSAHGTWVSDRKIEPHVPVELSEGDTLKLAASSRSYRLHWYPLSRAFDVQYVPLNFRRILPSVEEEEEKMLKEEDLISSEEEDPSPMPESVDFSLHGETRLTYSVCDEDESRNPVVALDQSLASEYFNSPCKQNPGPSAPPMPEPMNLTLPEDECHNQIVVVHQILAPESFNSPFKQNPSPYAPPNQEHMSLTLPEHEYHNQIVVVNQSLAPESFNPPFKQNPIPSAPPMPESMHCTLLEEDCYNRSVVVDQSLTQTSVYSPLSHGEKVFSEKIEQEIDKENQESAPTLLIESVAPAEGDQESTQCRSGKGSNKPSLWSRRGKAASLLRVQTALSKGENMELCRDIEALSENLTDIEDELSTKVFLSGSDGEGQTFTPDRENSSPKTVLGSYSPLSHGEKVFSEKIEQEIDKENQESAPTLLIESVAPAEGDQESTQCRSGKGSNKPSLWSRRGKAASLLRVQTALSKGENMELCRDIEVLSENLTDIEDELSTKVFLSASDGEGQTFTPDRENSSPKTVLGSYSKKKGTRGELELQCSYGSFCPGGDEDKGMSPVLDKENLTPAKENHNPRTVLGSNSRKKETSGWSYGFFPSRDEDKGISPFSDKENPTPAKENHTPRTVLGSVSVEKGGRGEIGLQWSYGSLPSSRDGVKSMSPFSDRENRTPVLLPVPRGKKPLSVSRLGQEAEKTMSNKKSGRLPLQSVETNSMSNDKSEVFRPLTNMTSSRSIKHEQGELMPKVLFTGPDEEEEIFTPGKENYTPKTGNALNSAKKGRREFELQKSYGLNQGMSPGSEKENITPKGCSHDARLKTPLSGSRLRLDADMIKSKRRAGRVPFQSLSDFTQTSSSGTMNCEQTTNASIPLSAKQSFGEANRKWYMVVGTNCLLNKESRKSLQLMKGLKETQLIIPRTVIRELEALKTRGSLFGSVTEASLVLQWIDECLLEAESWIHVQNSMEEHIPATPPASPSWSSWLSGESKRVFGRSMPLLPWTSLEAIVSPTAEDHILECALLYKKMKKDGRLVLLSDDIALKINAMAEGVLCETAVEFRASLIDPCSTRFLWAGSTPRGPTWSYLEEADLKENYCYFPVKNRLCRAADSAKKGLKLILRHKYSHHGKMTSVR